MRCSRSSWSFRPELIGVLVRSGNRRNEGQRRHERPVPRRLDARSRLADRVGEAILRLGIQEPEKEDPSVERIGPRNARYIDLERQRLPSDHEPSGAAREDSGEMLVTELRLQIRTR